MIYNNNEITALTYSGYNIVRVYSCGDKLVFGEAPIIPKKYHLISTGGTEYSVDCCDYEGCNELTPHDVIIAGRTGMIKSIEVGECITIIGTNVFAGETGMTDVTLPSTIAYIRDVLLTGCTAMQTLTLLGETPPTFHSTIHNISCCGLFDIEKDPEEPPEVIPTGFKIYVPSIAVNAYKTATVWSRYANYIESIP